MFVMAYEIEMRAILTKEKYEKLNHLFKNNYKQILEDTAQNYKFLPDVRVRFSKKINEIVIKDPDPTELSRKETVISLNSEEDSLKAIEFLKTIGLKEGGLPWKTTKSEFIYPHDQYEYLLSLQYTEGFAYILEVEFTDKEDNGHLHKNNIIKILDSFGCKEVEKEEFKKMIKDYHSRTNKK